MGQSIEEVLNRLVAVEDAAQQMQDAVDAQKKELAAQMEEKKDMRKAMIFLQQFGITTALAVKIFEKYGKANADGTFCFEGEGEQEASAELEELLELEVEPSCQRLDIPISEELRLSVNDLGALAPFVQFTEE